MRIYDSKCRITWTNKELVESPCRWLSDNRFVPCMSVWEYSWYKQLFPGGKLKK